MSRYQAITLLAVALVGLIFLSIYQGWYIQLRGDKYGRTFNEERITQNQPIIEDYFIKKTRPDRQSNSWVDTTESHIHLEKFYYTNLIGDLMYESDSYRPKLDSTWLAKTLNISDPTQLDYWRFNRLFYPGKGVESYYFQFRLKGETYRTVTLSMHTGDSLFQSLK